LCCFIASGHLTPLLRMDRADSTCWTVIQGAAAGCTADRQDFARRYAPIIRAYFAARWQESTYRQELDDGVQEVFLECFRQRGVLERADPAQPGGFRSLPLLWRVGPRHTSSWIRSSCAFAIATAALTGGDKRSSTSRTRTEICYPQRTMSEIIETSRSTRLVVLAKLTPRSSKFEGTGGSVAVAYSENSQIILRENAGKREPGIEACSFARRLRWLTYPCRVK
jgi:hypothetical protein